MASVSANTLCRLGVRVEEYVKKSVTVKANEAPERDYGYLVVMERDTENICLMLKVGDIPIDKMSCQDFAIEKCRRTIMSYQCSSWATRDFANKLFGGGIGGIELGGVHLVMAFSGLKEYADEAVCLAAARSIGLLDNGQVITIVDISSACTDYAVTTAEFLEALEVA